MDAGINKKRNINSAVVGLVLLASFLLHSFVNHAHADREDDEELAKKFAPILVLTENPTIGGRGRKVLNPEPVEIMGAESISNVQVGAITFAGGSYYWGPIISSPSLIQDFFHGVDFSSNKFAFLTGYEPQLFGSRLPDETFPPSHIMRIYVDYPGEDENSWNTAYFRLCCMKPGRLCWPLGFLVYAFFVIG